MTDGNPPELIKFSLSDPGLLAQPLSVLIDFGDTSLTTEAFLVVRIPPKEEVFGLIAKSLNVVYCMSGSLTCPLLCTRELGLKKLMFLYFACLLASGL